MNRLFLTAFVIMIIGINSFAAIDPVVIKATTDLIIEKGGDPIIVAKGVEQAARLWQEGDGNADSFKKFCEENYIINPAEKEAVFLKISNYLESIYGYYSLMSVALDWNTTIDTGPLHPIDYKFSAFSPSAHLSNDLYESKIAFIIVLNFPQLSLQEKEVLGNDRRAWAYARMGDMFTQRIPAEVRQRAAATRSDADIYTADYNIYMGSLLNAAGNKLFTPDMVLLAHWNLRDEIKANYNKGIVGIYKQMVIHKVMNRIVSQEIPMEAINSDKYDWNPYTNKLFSPDGKEIQGTPESTIRYQKMLNNFRMMQETDKYTGNTYIDRKFNEDMEIALEDAEALLDKFLSSPELKRVGTMIAQRLGRSLEPFDIWYDGFKARSNMDENKLSEQTRPLYPDAAAFSRDIPNILAKLGFSPKRAQYLGEKITVDAARGSGHALGATMKGQQSHLRTRIPAQGMDYKGFNIAVHELGHNVEQTISLYDVDYYMLNGVPNTAFTEALAFMFQKKDLTILGVEDTTNESDDKEKMDILDKVWSLYEISGVSMLDIAVWKWMYANPDADAAQLRDATITLAKEVWNKYYAPVFGQQDETILAIYSHMIGYPLYLSAYAFGQIVEFQLQSYIEDKNFAQEVDRIFTLGRLTPNVWMREATGTPLNTDALMEALRAVL
jgi:hypothetical protein